MKKEKKEEREDRARKGTNKQRLERVQDLRIVVAIIFLQDDITPWPCHRRHRVENVLKHLSENFEYLNCFGSRMAEHWTIGRDTEGSNLVSFSLVLRK